MKTTENWDRIIDKLSFLFITVNSMKKVPVDRYGNYTRRPDRPTLDYGRWRYRWSSDLMWDNFLPLKTPDYRWWQL